MADDTNLVDDFKSVKDSNPSQESDTFYADDVQAEAIAENRGDPESLIEDDDLEVTSSDLNIGDLDDDAMVNEKDDSGSYDEEATPAGDNVTDN